MKKAVVLLAHGSQKKEAKADLEQIVQKLAQKTGVTTKLACMQLAKPSFEETIEELSNQNYNNVLVIPFFLTNGTHMQEDIPELIQMAKEKHQNLSISTTDYLWPEPLMIDLLEKRVGHFHPPSPLTGASAIEQESFKIIDSLLPKNGFNDQELAIVKRLIHTSGDPSLTKFITFSENAIAKGLEAIKRGLPIITDVSMVEAGINKQLAASFSINIQQLIADEDVKKEAIRLNKTRACVAIKKLAISNPESIIAIGNAPTALLEIADLVSKKAINPALVIAMPVGFVGTIQSKEAIKKTKAEYICVEETRGGSNLAAATVNALLKIASGADK